MHFNYCSPQAFRIRLHQFSRNHTDVLDVRIANPLNCDEFVKDQIKDTGSWIGFEEFNQYCAILDLDGNGWSDRFGQLVHFNTPILKLASNHTGFFEHLFAPDVAIGQFHDLSDLERKAREMVDDCQAGGVSTRRLARTMQATSRVLMDQVGIAQAFAYTLHVYKNLSDWTLDASLQGFKAVNVSCCTHAKVPDGLAADISARVAGRATTLPAAGRRFLTTHQHDQHGYISSWDTEG